MKMGTKRPAAMGALAVTASTLLATIIAPGTAHASANACAPDVSVSVSSPVSYFIPAAGMTFKDGKGGTISVSVTKASTIQASLSSTAEVSVSEVVASAKVSVSASVQASTSITVGHTYTHNISANMYGNAQYGTYGYKVNWKKTRTNGNCQGETTLASGTATLPTTSVGWKYWETSS